MKKTLPPLIHGFSNDPLVREHAIPWTSPVPAFGRASDSLVATLGLNPSDREFIDSSGSELTGDSRRFPTLKSLNIKSWSHADDEHLDLIVDACENYFHRNPYDGWFKSLDSLIQGTGASYYSKTMPACHLDLVPYATQEKWSGLTPALREQLVSRFGVLFLRMLGQSKIRVLVLNGASVIRGFEQGTNMRLIKSRMPSWDLPRAGGKSVSGYAVKGEVPAFSKKGAAVLVLGFNHNIQSSFGVTLGVRREIKNWIARQTSGVLT